MNEELKVKCPAKINLSLKIVGKRPDGFHNIESIMQTINLYDYLTVKVSDVNKNEIILKGNSDKIPYDETNLVYKAAKLYLDTYQITEKKVEIYIDKNIPVSAGLAGGSTDAAGTLYALDKIMKNFPKQQFDKPSHDLDELCAMLGSDLNVCLHGGRILAKGRGEIVESLPFEEFSLSLIKPINLGISAKDAYTKYSNKVFEQKSLPPCSEFANYLEWAVIDDYKELKHIKQKYPDSIMTGSGSSYFLIDKVFEQEENYLVINNLKSINTGVVQSDII